MIFRFFKNSLLVINLFIYISLNAQSSEECRIVNNDFSIRPFGEVLTTKKLIQKLNGNVILEKEPVNNEHTDDVDTLFYYKHSNSIFTFYKSSKSIYFRSAIIKDKGIKIKDCIEIGNTKAEVMRAFNLPQSTMCDIILLVDDEDFSHHRFYFEQNRLIKIELDSGMD